MIRKLLLFLLIDIIVLVAAAAAQDVSVRYQSQVIGSRGVPLASQNVAVCTQPAVTTTQPCSPLATLASSTTTTSGGVNPLTTDTNGNFFFYAAPGKYTVQVYGPQVSGQFVQPDTIVGAAGPANVVSLTVSGTTLPSTGITLLNAQANAAAITGTGASATLYTYTLPANTVATLKGIRVTAGYNHSTGTASVNYTLTLNGQTIAAYSSAATGALVEQHTVLNLTSTTGSRVSIEPGASGGGSTSTITGLAWTSSQVLTLAFTVNNTDAVTPIQWIVELIQ